MESTVRVSITCVSLKDMFYLKLSTVFHDNSLRRLATLGSHSFNCINHIQSRGNFSKNDMLPIQPRGVYSADEKLRSISVRTGICHTKDPLPPMGKIKVLVRELVSVDALSSSAILVSEITSLTHELWNHTMKWAPLVTKAIFTRTEGTKVLC